MHGRLDGEDVGLKLIPGYHVETIRLETLGICFRWTGVVGGCLVFFQIGFVVKADVEHQCMVLIEVGIAPVTGALKQNISTVLQCCAFSIEV